MVFGRIRDLIQGEPTLPPGPIHLPEYFPVEPIGCEKKAQALFKCINSEATQKHRELEKKGLDLAHYQLRERSENESKEEQKIVTTPVNNDLLNTSEDDPLEPCRSLIAHYKRCCDRELKRKRNWKLTEPFRVQDEYRYKSNSNTK